MGFRISKKVRILPLRIVYSAPLAAGHSGVRSCARLRLLVPVRADLRGGMMEEFPTPSAAPANPLPQDKRGEPVVTGVRV